MLKDDIRVLLDHPFRINSDIGGAKACTDISAAGYIGMIGSKRKRNMIYQSLLEKGFEQTALDRVFSPVGVAINAQTPEEIAVSIVAELIRERAPEKKTRMA